MDTGDRVIIINADKGRYFDQQQGRGQAGLPPPATRAASAPTTYATLLAEARRGRPPHGPGHAPQNRLGRRMLKRAEVYAGPAHLIRPSSRSLAIRHARARAWGATIGTEIQAEMGTPHPDHRPSPAGRRPRSGCGPAPA